MVDSHVLSAGLQPFIVYKSLVYLCAQYNVELTSLFYRPKNGGQYCTGPEVHCQMCNKEVGVLVSITFILYNIHSQKYMYSTILASNACIYTYILYIIV